MSLINEALKKAQRARTGQPGEALPPVPGGGSIAKRSPLRGVNTMVLLGSGAALLVVISVVVTIVLLNRPSKPPPAPAVVAKPSPTTGKDSAPAIVKPLIPAPPAPAKAETPPVVAAPETKPAPASTPAAQPAQPVASPKSVPIAEQAPATAPATPPPAPPPVVPRQNDRIAAYVETLRIAGVRAAGADSRVLINERVYRINDIVDRTLGVRLIKVTQTTLTFSDQNGATYEKLL